MSYQIRKANGGPAFPVFNNEEECQGMTLRDWFAGEIMKGLVANSDCDFANAPEWAFRLADEMIEEKYK